MLSEYFSLFLNCCRRTSFLYGNLFVWNPNLHRLTIIYDKHKNLKCQQQVILYTAYTGAILAQILFTAPQMLQQKGGIERNSSKGYFDADADTQIWTLSNYGFVLVLVKVNFDLLFCKDNSLDIVTYINGHLQSTEMYIHGGELNYKTFVY